MAGAYWSTIPLRTAISLPDTPWYNQLLLTSVGFFAGSILPKGVSCARTSKCDRSADLCDADAGLRTCSGVLPGRQEEGSSCAAADYCGWGEWCPFCKEVQQRLASDPTVVPLSNRFKITFVNVEDKARGPAFQKQFQLQQISLPTLVVATAKGRLVDVSFGAPQGKDLPEFLEEALTKMQANGVGVPVAAAPADKAGMARAKAKDKEKEKEPRPKKVAAKEKEKNPEVEAQVEALREARKLLHEKKTAEAVEVVAPFVGPPRATGALGTFINSLEKEGHGQVASAREQLDKPDRIAIGAMALVKARRLYGKLPAVEKEIAAGLEVVTKAPQGENICKQAEAVDKGRAFDEAGDAAAAIEVYREVAAQYANSQVGAMAAKRVEVLERTAKAK